MSGITSSATTLEGALATVERLSLVEMEFVNGVPFAIVPKGKELQSLKRFEDERRDAPERRAGAAFIETLPSFCAHVNRFKDADSAVFLVGPREKTPAKLIAVYDYLPAGADMTKARFMKHRAQYTLEFSSEWADWDEVLDTGLSMGEFAQFLDAHIADVYLGDADRAIMALVSSLELTLASAGTLVRMSRNFAVNVDTKVQDVRTLSSGEISLVYAEQHRDGEGAPIKVPNAFTIAIPVFEGAPAYVCLVRLSYRVAGGQVKWFLRMHRPDAILRGALAQVAGVVITDCALPVFDGAPES